MARNTVSTLKYKGIYRCSISGLSHNNYAMYAKELEAGDELGLERDPLNRFDDYAIKVMYEGDQIGWIPKGQNEILSKLLDHGLDIRAKIISHEASQPLDKRLYVLICIGIEE